MQTQLVELIAKPEQRAFGDAERDSLPQQCRECPALFACHGKCPKNRFILTDDGEPGLNYLCAGYLMFFTHIDRPMQLMAELMSQEEYAEEAMPVIRAWTEARYRAAGHNDPCPCGSGCKFKQCHERMK